MRMSTLALATLIAVSCGSQAAAAAEAASVHAGISRFEFSLTDLDASDGQTPSFRWLDTGGPPSEMYLFDSVRLDNTDFFYRSDSAAFPSDRFLTLSRDDMAYRVGNHVQIPGAPSTLQLGADLELHGAATAWSGSWSANAFSSATGRFALSPHTQLTVTAVIDYDLQVSQMLETDGVLHSGDVSIDGSLGLSGSYFEGGVLVFQDRSMSQHLANHGGAPSSGERTLTVRFFNESSLDRIGKLHTSVNTYLDYGRVVEVPEPATTALMFGGLALLGACMRRRAAR